MQQKGWQRGKLSRFRLPRRAAGGALALALVLALVLAAAGWREWSFRSAARRSAKATATAATDNSGGFLAERVVHPELARRARTAEGSIASRLEVVTHIVEPGETLWGIAEQYGTDVSSLLANNGLDTGRIVPIGLKLRVLTGKGLIYRVRPGETLSELAERYSVSASSIMSANGLTDAARLAADREIIIPGAETPAAGRVQIASRGVSRESSSGLSGFIWPANGPITSPFGWRWGRLHKGIDIGASYAAPVVAARAGQVVSAGWRDDYGIAVVIDHGGGLRTLYAHLSRSSVGAGQEVAQGDVIGYVGATGNATGPHLHFELHRGGRVVNPLPSLP